VSWVKRECFLKQQVARRNQRGKRRRKGPIAPQEIRVAQSHIEAKRREREERETRRKCETLVVGVMDILRRLGGGRPTTIRKFRDDKFKDVTYHAIPNAMNKVPRIRIARRKS
jgi:hypothetical protein